MSEQLSDLEVTRACAEAMGFELNDPGLPMHFRGVDWQDFRGNKHPTWIRYNPLRDDSQAMALVKRFQPGIQPPDLMKNQLKWTVCLSAGNWIEHSDLNRAICLCVAKMHRREA